MRKINNFFFRKNRQNILVKEILAFKINVTISRKNCQIILVKDLNVVNSRDIFLPF